MSKKKKGVKWTFGDPSSALALRKTIADGCLAKFTKAKFKRKGQTPLMLTRIAIVKGFFEDENSPKGKGQWIGVETRSDYPGKHNGSIKKKGETEPREFFKGANLACDFYKAKDLTEVLFTAEELQAMKDSREKYQGTHENRTTNVVVGDYIAINKMPLGHIQAVEWIKRTGKPGEWLAVQVDCKIDSARSSDINELFFTDPSTAEFIDKDIKGCWDSEKPGGQMFNQGCRNSQEVYPECHGTDGTARVVANDAGFKCEYLRQPHRWNFSSLLKQEDKYDKALKNLRSAVKAKIDLQREKLERTMREKVSFKRDQFEEEERVLKMKIDERQETIDKYQLRLEKDLLMTPSQREGINREIEKLLADKRRMQQDLRRFQIHSEEECLLLHHDHAKHLKHEMTTALAQDLTREVQRKKARMQRQGENPRFVEDPGDEWDAPTDQALREVEQLKAENAEVMKALQAIKEEIGEVATDTQQVMRKLKCMPADDVDDFRTPGGDYYRSKGGFSSDEEDPLGDLEDLMDLSGVRQNAINLVNTLIGDDGALEDYGDTIGGYGDTAGGPNDPLGDDYDFGATGGADYSNIDDLLGDFDKGIGDDDF